MEQVRVVARKMATEQQQTSWRNSSCGCERVGCCDDGDER